jgi:hypothetical protein
MPVPKSDVEDMQNDWECELGLIARRLKADHGADTPLLKLMGSLAWGRYPHENGPNTTKDSMLRAVGYLEGVRDTCMKAGQLNGYPGTELFERIYDGISKRQKDRADERLSFCCFNRILRDPPVLKVRFSPVCRTNSYLHLGGNGTDDRRPNVMGAWSESR